MGVSLRLLPYPEYQALHPAFTEDLYEVFDFCRLVAARDVEGGTSLRAVRAQIERAKDLIAGQAFDSGCGHKTR